MLASWLGNLCWWRLDVPAWRIEIKRYGPGTCHPTHADLHVGQLERKLAISAQLSAPDDYEGGTLYVLPTVGVATHDAVKVPRDRGTIAMFPGWVRHGVTEVTGGERWALIAWTLGEPIR
jgi:PKHD-type hydroxylase